jgi:hypothetical protein
MDKMKLNSKIGYKRNRVISGNEPHRLLKMIQEKALQESVTDSSQDEVHTET